MCLFYGVILRFCKLYKGFPCIWGKMLKFPKKTEIFSSFNLMYSRTSMFRTAARKAGKAFWLQANWADLVVDFRNLFFRTASFTVLVSEQSSLELFWEKLHLKAMLSCLIVKTEDLASRQAILLTRKEDYVVCSDLLTSYEILHVKYKCL